MRQLSIFDFLDEEQSQSTAAQAGLLEKQSNISSNITASNAARDVAEVSAYDMEGCHLLRQWREIKSQYPDALFRREFSQCSLSVLSVERAKKRLRISEGKKEQLRG